MAATVRVRDLTAMFVLEVDDTYMCSSCKKVMREPHRVTCCGRYSCKSCVDKISQHGTPCPGCEDLEFSIEIDRELREKIEALQIYCPMKVTRKRSITSPIRDSLRKQQSCKWVGSLAEVEEHLAFGKVLGECEFMQVSCPHGCNTQVPRKSMEMHQQRCNRRPYCCLHCGIEDTYEIAESHPLRCPKFPVACSKSCGKTGIQRNQVEKHLENECPLYEVRCDFHYAGCQARTKRTAITQHLQENMYKHLTMAARHSAKLDEHCKKLEETVSELQETCTGLRKTCTQLQEKCTELERKQSTFEWI